MAALPICGALRECLHAIRTARDGIFAARQRVRMVHDRPVHSGSVLFRQQQHVSSFSREAASVTVGGGWQARHAVSARTETPVLRSWPVWL